MKNEETNNDLWSKKISKRDIVIIVISLLAVIGLIVILKLANESNQQKSQQLQDYNKELQVSGSNIYTEDTVDLQINEVNQSGWIELYNNGRDNVSITGLTVYLNGKLAVRVSDEVNIAGNTYTVIENTKALSLGQENVITIYDADNNPIKSMKIPELEKNQSYGCVAESEYEMARMSSTKEESNASATLVAEDGMQFSAPGGFYDNEFKLTISVPEGYSVYYTSDATEPEIDESMLYEDSIQIKNPSGSQYQYVSMTEMGAYPTKIDMGTVIRAIMVDASGEIVEEQIQTYFVGIGNNNNLKNLPVISITTNPENLFDYFEGIYVSGRTHEDAIASGEDSASKYNFMNGWEKSAYIEFYEATKEKTYEANVNLSIINDVSQTQAQKSFLAKTENEANPGSGISTYLNNTKLWLEIQTNKYDNTYKLRNYLTDELLEDTAVGTREEIACTVFVDGEYWGVYMLKAPYDETYVQNKYGVPQDMEVAFASDGVVQENKNQSLLDDAVSFVVNNDMSNEKNFEVAQKLFDLDSLLDYICANIYLANGEFGTDTYYLWRTVETSDKEYCDGKWRWLMGRCDNVMNNGAGEYSSTYSIDTYLQEGFAKDVFIQSLLRNDTFCQQLSDRMNEMIAEKFEVEHVSTVLDELAKYMEKAVISSYTRYNYTPSDSLVSDEVNKIKTFFEKRAEYITIYTEEVCSAGGDLSFIEEADEAVSKQKASDSEKTDRLEEVAEQDNASAGSKAKSEKDTSESEPAEGNDVAEEVENGTTEGESN